MNKPTVALYVLCACACNDDPATAQVDNAYGVMDGGAGSSVVYKAWWSSTLFTDPISPGASSDPQRAVTNTDVAYAIIARGWDPTSTDPPPSLVVLRSSTRLTVVRGDDLHLVVSPNTFVGDCAHASVLSQDEADFITERIFPGDFAGFHYDAASCTLTAAPTLDGGTD